MVETAAKTQNVFVISEKRPILTDSANKQCLNLNQVLCFIHLKTNRRSYYSLSMLFKKMTFNKEANRRPYNSPEKSVWFWLQNM